MFACVFRVLSGKAVRRPSGVGVIIEVYKFLHKKRLKSKSSISIQEFPKFLTKKKLK